MTTWPEESSIATAGCEREGDAGVRAAGCSTKTSWYAGPPTGTGGAYGLSTMKLFV